MEGAPSCDTTIPDFITPYLPYGILYSARTLKDGWRAWQLGDCVLVLFGVIQPTVCKPATSQAQFMLKSEIV